MKKVIVGLSAFLLSVSLYAFEGELISTGDMSMDNALVELEPKPFNAGELVFTLYVNTHSVSFEFFDLQDSTTLYVNGRQLKPVRVPSLYSHHNEGELVFELSEDIETDVRVVIVDMAGEATREFYWPKP